MGGGAWPFLVGEVTCLVNSDNGRDLDLLINNVHSDGYLLLRGTLCLNAGKSEPITGL
jgi:hypothetical protein